MSNTEHVTGPLYDAKVLLNLMNLTVALFCQNARTMLHLNRRGFVLPKLPKRRADPKIVAVALFCQNARRATAANRGGFVLPKCLVPRDRGGFVRPKPVGLSWKIRSIGNKR
jgi:hypothetical protein